MKLEPMLALEFFDIPEFVPNQQVFLEKTQLIKDEFHFDMLKNVVI